MNIDLLLVSQKDIDLLLSYIISFDIWCFWESAMTMRNIQIYHKGNHLIKIKMSVPVPKFSHLYLDSKGGNGSWTSSVLENIIWKTLKTIKLRGTRPREELSNLFSFFDLRSNSTLSMDTVKRIKGLQQHSCLIIC